MAELAWRGALQLTIRGVPQAISIELYLREKNQRNESFKNLDPVNKLPVRRPWVDSEGKEVPQDQLLKGVETAKDTYAVMKPEALEKIEEGGKTVLLEAETFVPRDSIEWDLAFNRYAVRPREEIPGSKESLDLVWNGLRAGNFAWVNTITMRGGKHDAIIAFYATDEGMFAALLPFEDELYSLPEYEFTQNTAYAEAFVEHVEGNYDVQPFDHSQFVSEYRARRQAAIAAVLNDEEIEIASPPEPQEVKVDLFAALTAKKEAA